MYTPISISRWLELFHLADTQAEQAPEALGCRKIPKGHGLGLTKHVRQECTVPHRESTHEKAMVMSCGAVISKGTSRPPG